MKKSKEHYLNLKSILSNIKSQQEIETSIAAILSDDVDPNKYPDDLEGSVVSDCDEEFELLEDDDCISYLITLYGLSTTTISLESLIPIYNYLESNNLNAGITVEAENNDHHINVWFYLIVTEKS